MNVVLDTNVLVSVLWSADSKPYAIVSSVLNHTFTLCYDYRILEEYVTVLHRPKFLFSENEINVLINGMTKNGISIIPNRSPNVPFTDESDRKFYEVAKFCNAKLITGNIKHFPKDSCVMTVSEFIKTYL